MYKAVEVSSLSTLSYARKIFFCLLVYVEFFFLYMLKKFSKSYVQTDQVLFTAQHNKTKAVKEQVLKFEYNNYVNEK